MLKDILQVNDFSIIVSLPENNMEYAIAAVEAGAKILKVHINAYHNATKQKFGPYADEKWFLKTLAAYAKDHDLCIGIVPGDLENYASEIEMNELSEMGFDFISSYVQNMPVYLNRVSGMEKVIAVGKDFKMNRIQELEKFGAKVIEASIMEASDYGKAFSLYDLLRIKEVAAGSKLPVIVPTQKKIAKEDMIFLHEAGVKALMIGAVVYEGEGIEGFKKTVKGYITEASLIRSKHESV